MTVQRATILLCSLAFAVLAGSAAARPSRHQPVPAAQTDAADSDIRYPAAAAATPTVATEERGSRHSRRSMTAYQAAQSHANSADAGFTGNSLVEQARQYIGTNPTGRSSLWCGAFMDMVLKHTGHNGGGNLARAYAHYGTRISGPQVGAIAVMARGGGGHVGVVSGIDSSGNPIVISGNHNNTVAESIYPRGRIIAYVMPN
jgi:uncharacterized protein (TIGR02594 family)